MIRIERFNENPVNKIDAYKENGIIIWAPFISASKSRTNCLKVIQFLK